MLGLKSLSIQEKVHLWAEAASVEVNGESCRHLWVEISTLGRELGDEMRERESF